MKEEMEKRLKEEAQQNWEKFKIWVKKEYPFMLDLVKKYDKKLVIPEGVASLMHEFLRMEMNGSRKI